MTSGQPIPDAITLNLLRAAQANDLPGAQAAVTAGADLSFGRYTALTQAAGQGHVPMVAYLLTMVPPERAARTLYSAIKNNQAAIIEVLLDHGIALLPDHLEYLVNQDRVQALSRMRVTMAPEAYQRSMSAAIRRGSATAVAFLVAHRPVNHTSTGELVQALQGEKEDLIPSLLPGADLLAAEERLASSHQFEALDRLAALVEPNVRQRMVEAWGTRHLPKSAERSRIEQRAAHLASRPAGPSPVSRRRSRA